MPDATRRQVIAATVAVASPTTAPSSGSTSTPAPALPAVTHTYSAAGVALVSTQIGLDSRGLPIPDYPAASRRRGEEGLVLLDVEVLPNGTAGQVTVVTSSGYDRLNAAAITAARISHFQPARIDGQPTTAHLKIPYQFTLQN